MSTIIITTRYRLMVKQLFHAMMALAALSLAHQNGLHSADALEHYQQVIPALKNTVQSSQDSYSDGALFTHFVLLLYEVSLVTSLFVGLAFLGSYVQFAGHAACKSHAVKEFQSCSHYHSALSNSQQVAAGGHRDSNMWRQQIDQLLRIATLRYQAHGFEVYEFVIWIICCIDVYALLSNSGTGVFMESLLKQNMLPAPERSLAPISRDHEQIFYPEEQSFFPAVLELNQAVLLLALKVGQLGRDLRAETLQRQYENPNDIVPEPVFLVSRQTRVQALHHLMQSSRVDWRARYPVYWTWLGESEPPPRRVFAWIEHARIVLCLSNRFLLILDSLTCSSVLA